MANEEIKEILGAMRTTHQGDTLLWHRLAVTVRKYNISPEQLGTLLKESDVDLNAYYYGGHDLEAGKNHSLLTWAAGRGYTDMVQALLIAGADTNAQDNEENTPLHSTTVVD